MICYALEFLLSYILFQRLPSPPNRKLVYLPGALAGPSGYEDTVTLEKAEFTGSKLMGHTVLENLHTPNAVVAELKMQSTQPS